MAKLKTVREISCTYVFVLIIATAIAAYVGFIVGLHHGEHLVPNNKLNLHNFHDNTLQTDKKNETVKEERPASNHIQSKEEDKSIPTKCPETPPCAVCKVIPKEEPIKCPEATKCPTCKGVVSNKGKSTTDGTKWSSIDTLNSYAIHELLIPNFPPRKDNNPKNALLLTHGSQRPEYQQGILENHNPYNFADLTSTLEERDQVSKDLSSCDEVNIVIAKGDGRVCLAVLESYDAPPYHVFRMRRNKDQGWVHASRYENHGGNMPSIPDNLDGPSMRKMGTNASALLNNFMFNRPRIDTELKPLLEKLSSSYGKKGPIVLLAVNAGVLDLVLNFICSVRRLQAGGVGEHGDILKSILVFAADEEVEVTLKQLGVATYRHQALGSFPTASATGYGDDVFTSMMWLKVVSVYTVLRLGFDVLFQDADVIWWRDPRPYFTDSAKHTNGQKYDAYFQNDGARSQRYAPFSANSGFYFLRSNPKSRMLMHDLLHQYNLISQWHSHQHVLCQLLVEHYTKTGLNVQILPHRFFSIGQQYHRKKDFMLNLKLNKLDPFPYMFHWSWTAGKSEKLKYSIETGMWYLKPQCNEKAIRSNKGDSEYLDNCCLMPTGEEHEHPYLYDSPLTETSVVHV